MLNDFQLVVLAKKGREMRLFRVPLHQRLQDTLATTWEMQLDSFLENIQELDFDAGYNPEEHERFRLENYELPEWLAGEDGESVADLDPVSSHEDLLASIKGIAAFVRDDHRRNMILFQNFSRSHVIRPGNFLFLRGNTYISAQRPGLTLDDKLSAVYFCQEKKLLFHNFRIANTFLPLTDVYKEASEEEIRMVLGHERLAPEDPDALAVGANQWFRKRFAMLRDSGVLEQYTVEQIQQHSAGYEVDIVLDGDRIVFPAERPAAKRLLQFLNEEIFRGAITETLYETNSKREADL